MQKTHLLAKILEVIEHLQDRVQEAVVVPNWVG